MKKERIALVFGTFAPLHQGHIDLIQRPSVSVIAFVSLYLVMKGIVVKKWD